MATKYNIPSEVNGVNGFGSPYCADTYTTTLAANTVATLTVPASASMGNALQTKKRYLAVFSYHAARNVYVAINETAAVPAGATLVASTSELNPPAKVVVEGDVISIICATASTDVSIALYDI